MESNDLRTSSASHQNQEEFLFVGSGLAESSGTINSSISNSLINDNISFNPNFILTVLGSSSSSSSSAVESLGLSCRQQNESSSLSVLTTSSECSFPSYFFSESYANGSFSLNSPTLSGTVLSSALPSWNSGSNSNNNNNCNYMHNQFVGVSRFAVSSSSLSIFYASSCAPASQTSPTPAETTSTGLPYSTTLELLECSVCFDCMGPPIYQCKEGHVLCNECTTKVTHCPICRSQPVNIRCRALEKLSDSLPEQPCKYSRFGCTQLLKYSCKNEHELKCTMKPYACLHFQNGCNFEGTADDLVGHLVCEHNYERHESNQINFLCQRPNVVIYRGDETEHYIWQKQIYSCYDKHFVLRIHRKVDYDPHFYISIVALHSKHHPNRYSISAFGNHRKYTFEGPVWTIRKGFGEMERVRDCLMLPENIALFLSGGKGSENDLNIINLAITGEIMPP